MAVRVAISSNRVLGCISHSSSSPRRGAFQVRAAIAVGDKLPDATFSFIDKEGHLQTVNTAALTKGKRAVLFAIPGAFTPTCTQRHLPGFVQKSEELTRRGVHTIACISVNDVFVLKAWGESLGIGDKVLLLSDGSTHFTRAMGTILDLRHNALGLGVRSCRYSLLAEDSIVKLLNLEDGGAFSTSGVDDILKRL